MTVKFSSLVLTLATALAVSGCVAASKPLRPTPAALAQTAPNEVISGILGETLYTQTVAPYEWELVVDAPVSIGNYVVEPGTYTATGIGAEGYFFEPGDGCVGEPSVRAGRFADAPAALYRPVEDGTLCVAAAYDTQRCAPARTRMRSVIEEGAEPVEYALIYDGLALDEDGRRAAVFTLEQRSGVEVLSDTFFAPAPGVLTVQSGVFQIRSAGATDVRIAMVQPIGGVSLLAPPPLLGERVPQDDLESIVEATEALIQSRSWRED